MAITRSAFLSNGMEWETARETSALPSQAMAAVASEVDIPSGGTMKSGRPLSRSAASSAARSGGSASFPARETMMRSETRPRSATRSSSRPVSMRIWAVSRPALGRASVWSKPAASQAEAKSCLARWASAVLSCSAVVMSSSIMAPVMPSPI